MLIWFPVEEIIEEHPAEVYPSTGAGAPTTWRTTKHPQACRRSVQQGSSTRLEGSPIIRHERRSQENTGHQDGTGQRLGGTHQHNQQLLPRGDCQVSHSATVK